MRAKPDKSAPAAREAGKSKMGQRLEDQAREKIRQEDAKRSDFARGKKRFTEGK
jgi:hypothetical protein